MSQTIVNVHFQRHGHGRAVFMREGLLRQIERRPQDEIAAIQAQVLALRDGPFTVVYEKLSYHIASNLYVLWDSGFYFLYRVHKPASGPYAGYEWVVHILDIDGFYLDGDGNRILDLYTDPDAIRTLAERDGEIVTSSR